MSTVLAHPSTWRPPPLFGSRARQRLALAALAGYLVWSVSDLEVDIQRVLAARGLIVLGRTFHEVIIAIFFVKLFGFGPVAGLLTLVFASAIFLGKMLAEDIENVRMGAVEAIRATGAGFGQTVVYSIVPQVLSRTVGVVIYRLDANVRHSTVIGIVGAGGIGQTLSASFSRYDYDFALAILLSIIALVALGEWFSDWVRRRLR